jgi:hypothetical protein
MITIKGNVFVDVLVASFVTDAKIHRKMLQLEKTRGCGTQVLGITVNFDGIVWVNEN